jgi:hypothetical protein
MKAFSIPRHILLAIGALLFGFGMSACGDDPVAPDPNAGKTAPATMFHAQYDEQPAKVDFVYNTQILADDLTYGMTSVEDVQIGSNTTIKITPLSGGNQLASASAKVDSLTSTWFVYTGSGSEETAFAVATPKGTAVAGAAGIRMIHASPGAPKLELHQLAANGGLVGDVVEYKKSSATFTPVLVATQILVITREDDTEVVSLPVVLEAGKFYTVVVYGNPTQAATSNKITAKLVVEP